MKIDFYGAAGCVTGSSHLLKVKDKRILLDCGMYQGRDEKERDNEAFNFIPKDIDYLILSHAHIDHSGRIPLLYKQGFKGKIVCTEGTKDLCQVMLEDSGHIQEMEAEWDNKKRMRKGQGLVEPLYTARMANLSMYLFEGYPYDLWIELFDGFKLRFRDAGHLLGSAIIEIIIEENGEKTKLVYSGDLGNKQIPILKDPAIVDEADYLILETTYGDRLHEVYKDDMMKLLKIIQDTFKRGGNVIIPSFAVGRTQEIIYALNNYVEQSMLKNISVYVDSPLAIETTEIFKYHTEYFDKETQDLLEKGDDPFAFEGLVYTNSTEESLAVNRIKKGAVIISASGMCDAGRIKHHLKHNLWRKESSIVFIGYQAEGTLGRNILNGAKMVKIFGEEIAVNAQVYSLQGLSGHADRKGLMDWVSSFKEKPKAILLVHGEEEGRESFNKLLLEKGYKSIIMKMGDTFNPGEEESEVKKRIMNLLDSLKDVDSIKTEDLIEKIRGVLQ